MVNFKTKTNGNVILVEPNSININNDVVNGIPQYQDMYIFAELTAISKGRTVIINGNATSTDSKKINFLGNNQDDKSLNNPNRLNFTTNYYDGSTGNQTHYEGFGINSIKIVVNSSYVPQVDIQFIDVRGLAFFNQNDSPYRVLFDFPPPIFTLIIKGYYGKAITYQLHLVKYTSEFSASNGNFIIDAQFVAVTFAPLADILFRYIVNAPLIDNEDSMSPVTGEEPSNTFALILKLKNLYTAIAKKLKTDTENKEYDSIQKQIDVISEIGLILKSVINGDNEKLKSPGIPHLIMSSPAEDYNLVTLRPSENYRLKIIKNLSEYNEIIKNEEITGVKNNISNRLYIGYIAGTNLPLTDDDYNPLANESDYVAPPINPFASTNKNYEGFETALSFFKTTLNEKNLPAFNIESGDIGNPEPFTNGVNIETAKTVETEYYALDITKYYRKLYEKNLVLNEDKNFLSNKLAEKINNMVSQNLGMTPTIYNIFKIILNDVDTFFSKLSKASKLAEEAHNASLTIRETIANNNIDSPTSKGNIPDRIYPFPLMIKESAVYGGVKKERVAPIELAKTVSFPEIDFVTKFMDTFPSQRNIAKLYDTRINQNDDGTYKWMPITPLDSVLGGVSPESPYLNLNNNIRAEIAQIFMKRFYMVSQGSLSKTFYEAESSKRKAYIDLYSNGEAINVISTLISQKNADTVELMAKDYKDNVQGFYDYIESIPATYDNGSEIVSNNLYSFPQNDPKYFPVTPSKSYEGRVYVNKYDSNFVGVNWYVDDIVIPNTTDIDNSDKPIDKFHTESKNKWYKPNDAEYLFYNFTQENVIFLRDINADDDDISDNVVINGLSMFTRYLTNKLNGYEKEENVPNPYFPGSSTNISKHAITGQKIAYNEGNSSFESYKTKDKSALKYGNNIFNIWTQQLSDHAVVDVLTGGSTQNLSTVLILSNFGTTASPFNKYSNQLNSLVFDTPAAIEVPTFYAPYLGALLTAIDDGWVGDILTFFTGTTGDNGVGADFTNKGFYVLADLHDVQTYLSENDKDLFKQAYQDYSNDLHGTIVIGIQNLCKSVRENTDAGGTKTYYSESIGYAYKLNQQYIVSLKNGTNKGEYYWIIQLLMERKTIVNFSQITFDMSNTYNDGYTSIETLHDPEKNNNAVNAISANKQFFQTFFSRLYAEITTKKLELKEEEEELNKAKGDDDIITQLYYSFKNINDKWLTGSLNSNGEYPYNKDGKKLINSFAFVDRAMNPIGETVINAEILIDMLDDPNISLFGVLTQLLSLNGFEFFPLQNFMRIDNTKSWEDSFKIDTSGVYEDLSTAFICMYIGGSSSYPSTGGNSFENDGIIDISEPGVTDFLTTKPDDFGTVNDLQEKENTDFPWRQVRAFRVRFGEQNQSMFTDVKIDSKEYPETNESIQILSRLAGDNNPDAPVPKGQNLYNLYENRSYKATVTGFGNAMIQPTQYFQLENVPLFNGAYIILNVEHNITANKMTTSFSGTKLLKYPVPRVLNPMAFTNYNPNESAGNVVVSAANVSNRNETHYNAMYDNTPNSLKIE